MLVYCIFSFIFGSSFGVLLMYLITSHKVQKIREENVVLNSKLNSFDEIRNFVRNDFVCLAHETIQKEQEDLRKQNREVLEEKIFPLTKELGEFRDKVEKLNLAGVENTTKIVDQISILEKNNNLLSNEANKLVEALTKNQNVKGAYGEHLLDVVLQIGGMVEGVHYIKQFSTTSESFKDCVEHKIRPDVIINLPNKHHIIIDSKVTLASYLNYLDNEANLKDFKAEIKKRILELSNKNYQNAEDLLQPDFVLMYMPIEKSLNIIYEDKDLLDYAYKANVIIVGTSSLLVTIRLVNQLMSYQNQSVNLRNIVDAGTNLYETFTMFCNDLLDVQKKFIDLNKTLNTTINRFRRDNNNKPNLFKQVEKLKEYGITTNRQIPVEFVQNVDDEVI